MAEEEPSTLWERERLQKHLREVLGDDYKYLPSTAGLNFAHHSGTPYVDVALLHTKTVNGTLWARINWYDKAVYTNTPWIAGTPMGPCPANAQLRPAFARYFDRPKAYHSASTMNALVHYVLMASGHVRQIWCKGSAWSPLKEACAVAKAKELNGNQCGNSTGAFAAARQGPNPANGTPKKRDRDPQNENNGSPHLPKRLNAIPTPLAKIHDYEHHRQGLDGAFRALQLSYETFYANSSHQIDALTLENEALKRGPNLFKAQIDTLEVQNRDHEARIKDLLGKNRRVEFLNLDLKKQVGVKAGELEAVKTECEGLKQEIAAAETRIRDAEKGLKNTLAALGVQGNGHEHKHEGGSEMEF
ncbi:hypothetical protein BDV95DRAFT_623062 [Massariosphaeria phaeospora]|uniref:Uncharacterized protein n=1 Tax=Massariosphaeria phaeospora TaxID=100035 RepID=A0A7C8M884_9PLEO|nr:hypothetical protein BDV95DRAFT_623062 [Massariosphaeria phaeospora]